MEENVKEGIVDARSVDKLGIKLQDENFGRKGWINFDGENTDITEEEMKDKLSKLNKGDKIQLILSDSGYFDFTVLEAAKREQKDSEDIVGLEALLDSAHRKYKKLSIRTEKVELDREKGFAQFKCTVECELGTFEDYGDATKDKLQEHLKDSYIRMAQTRSIVRALRFATNTAKVSEEELDVTEKSGKNPE